jgi:transposase-like protein
MVKLPVTERDRQAFRAGGDEAIYKIMNPALRNGARKWTMPIKEWGATLNRFAVFFGERVPLL